MGISTNVSPYAEMWSGADRVWRAAWQRNAGKAPKILVTSPQTDLSTGGLLIGLGVPKKAVAHDLELRNTEEVKSVGRFWAPIRYQNGLSREDLLPHGSALAAYEFYLHERLGCWGHKIFR